MRTPWGEAQRIERIAPGIEFVSTASHGGYRLDSERNSVVPRAWRAAGFNGLPARGWYEEDCDWSMVALTFSQFFQNELPFAKATFERYIAPKICVVT